LLTAIAFIIIGVLKSYVNGMSKIKWIIQTLGLWWIAAALAYFVWNILENIVR
jgi:VIT1/CCC1 family predicted Fe2+/Mn2+ transporter